MVESAKHMMADNTGDMICPTTVPQHTSSWTTKPPFGRLKCNCDAAFCSDENLTVQEGEAMGLLTAIQWAIDLDLENASFELDCKLVVDHIETNKEDISEFGTIYYCESFFL